MDPLIVEILNCIIYTRNYDQLHSFPGFFTEGSVKHTDAATDSKPNSVAGELPDGVYDDNTQYQFCCKNSGFDQDELFLPSRKPFVLIKREDQNCQLVRGWYGLCNYHVRFKVLNKTNKD